MFWFCSYRMALPADKVPKKAQIFQCNTCRFFEQGTQVRGHILARDWPSPIPLFTLWIPGRVLAWPREACGHTEPSGEGHHVIWRRTCIGTRMWWLGFCGWPQRRRYAVGQGPFHPVLAVRKPAGRQGTCNSDRRGLGVEAAKTAGPGRRRVRGAGRGRSAVRARDPQQWTFSAAGGPGPVTCRRGHEGSARACFATRSGCGRTSSSHLSGPNRTGSDGPRAPEQASPSDCHLCDAG